MRISVLHSPLTYINYKNLISIFALLLFSACDDHEQRLAEREARIRARESELVTLFAELVEQKKSLEKNESDKILENSEDPPQIASNNCSCELPNADESNRETAVNTETKTLLGELEYVHLDPPGLAFSARIDTGARTSSLNAIDIVEFERDGKPFVKFKMHHPQSGELIELTRRLRRHVRIKERGDKEAQRRPVVRIRVMLADINEQIDFTLENRSKFKHQVLIGRNLLSDLAIVDVSKKFITAKTDNSDSIGKK